jgi:hypothetical protein
MGGVDVYIHIFLTSELVGGEWSASRPCRFTPGTHFIGGWVDPRAGLGDMEKWKFLPYCDSGRSMYKFSVTFIIRPFVAWLMFLIICSMDH